MRVIAAAIRAFVSSDRQSCSVIAVYNGIRVPSGYATRENPLEAQISFLFTNS
jgi:hypothetical protein